MQHRLRLQLVRVRDCIPDRAQDLQVGRVKGAGIMLSHSKLDVFGNELAETAKKVSGFDRAVCNMLLLPCSAQTSARSTANAAENWWRVR